MPDAVGVPLIVIVLDAHVAETPAGKPLAPDTPSFDIPVAPVVTIVMLVNAVLMHRVGDEDGAPAVFTFTVTVAVLFVLIVLLHIAGDTPLESVFTVKVEVADNEIEVNVPVLPLKTIVAVLPVVVGLVVL